MCDILTLAMVLLSVFCGLQEGRGSQDSLERRASLPRMKSYDAVVFDVLRVSPEDFAVSITLMYYVFGIRMGINCIA